MSQDLYSTLELPRGADSSEIRKQYLKLSRIHHPDKASAEDKTTAEEKFKKISHAYEILSDDSKKAFYDQTGQVPGDNGGGPPPGHPFGGMHGMPGMPGMPGFGMPFDMNNLFGMFGGGMPRGGPPQKTREVGKAPSRKTQIPLTLKDFYYGRNIKIHLDRNRFCGGCKGEGSTTVRSCIDCNGSGTKTQIIQMGPMIINNTGPCASCQGAGKTRGDPCGQCSGSKFTKQDKDLDLNIQKGMKSGDVIVFPGESSNVEEYTEAGDVQVELVTADEDHGWERIGDTLKYKVGLTLGEALCGKVIKIDGHPAYEAGLFVEIPSGVQNRQDIMVDGCGMPHHGSQGFGDAILSLSVVLTKEERAILESQKETLQGLFSIHKSDHDSSSPILQAKPLVY